MLFYKASRWNESKQRRQIQIRYRDVSVHHSFCVVHYIKL